MTVPSGPDGLIAEIRANVVFETMIVSVLTVSALSLAAAFVIGLVWRALGAPLSINAVFSALMAAVAYAFIFFLAGFAFSLAVGFPLYRRLEKAKIRQSWPFILAAFIGGFLFLALVDAAPAIESPERLINLAPGVATAWLFGRRMRPIWRAATRDSTAPTIVRLH